MTPTTWVFDVDGCLVDSLTGTTLRPGGLKLLSELRNDGLTVVLWSAGGASYAHSRAVEQGIDNLAASFHSKDKRDAVGRYQIDHLFARNTSVVFVDDRPEDLPVGVDIIAVSPYLSADPYDRGLSPVAERAGIDLWSDERGDGGS